MVQPLLRGFWRIWPVDFDIGRLHFPDRNDLGKIEHVGLALSRQHDSHSGLFFKDSLGTTKLIQFSGGYSRVEVPIDDNEFVWSVPDLEPEQLLQIAVLCEELESAPARIQYRWGFSEEAKLVPGVFFAAVDGCEGLTCATFIALLCLQCGVRLLRFDGWWPDKEDRQYQIEFIARIAPDRPDLVPVFRQDLGAYRFRPEDVCSAGLFRRHPVGFFKIRQAGSFVSTEIDNYYRRVGLK